jgi:hypothetical protein
MHLGNWLSRVVVDAVASREGSRPPAGEARRPLSSQGIPNGVPGRSCPFVARNGDGPGALSGVECAASRQLSNWNARNHGGLSPFCGGILAQANKN